MDYHNAFHLPLLSLFKKRENQLYSMDEKKNKEFIDFFVAKYTLQLLQSMYYNNSSYYYDSTEHILYKVVYGFDKYKAHELFQIVTDNNILAYNGIHDK